jgi:hypothetical protein
MGKIKETTEVPTAVEPVLDSPPPGNDGTVTTPPTVEKTAEVVKPHEVGTVESVLGATNDSDVGALESALDALNSDSDVEFARLNVR